MPHRCYVTRMPLLRGRILVASYHGQERAPRLVISIVQGLPFIPHEGYGPHLINASLNNCAPQTGSRSVHPFLHSSTPVCPYCSQSGNQRPYYVCLPGTMKVMMCSVYIIVFEQSANQNSQNCSFAFNFHVSHQVFLNWDGF